LSKDSCAPEIDADRLIVDPAERLFANSAAAPRPEESRAFFMAVLTASFALHIFTLLILDFLEGARQTKPDAALEIPVELVSDPDADKPVKANKADSAKKEANAAPASADQAGQKSESKPEAKPSTQAMQAVQSESKPPAETAAKPPQQPLAEKTAAADSKPPASETKPPESPKPAPTPAMQQESPKLAAAPQPAAAEAPQKPAAAPPAPVKPTVTASLQPITPGPAAASSPYSFMQDPFEAIAVPAPSSEGDEELSFKTVVFSKLELAKQFPQDARARGAHGTATIYFVLDDNGQVKSVKLLQSSGDASLDVESLALVVRAAPFPKPPPGSQKAFAATIEFDFNEK
jgi:TonB family protein